MIRTAGSPSTTRLPRRNAMIDRKAVLARLEALKAQRKDLQAKVEQLSCNINAYNGAIEDCEYWLAQLPEKAPMSLVPEGEKEALSAT